MTNEEYVVKVEENTRSLISFLQTKVTNQAKEINELTRKLNSAQRVNRGLQRKKDIRLNIIDELRDELEWTYDDFNALAEELHRAYALIGVMAVGSTY